MALSPAPIPKLSFDGGTQQSSAGADSFAQSGTFGDFYFGGSGLGGVGTTSSSITSSIIFIVVLLVGVLLWKKSK